MAFYSFSGLLNRIIQKLSPAGGDKIVASELREVLSDMVNTTEAYNSIKVNMVATTSVADTTSVASGDTRKLIIQEVSGVMTLYMYSPTATPKLQRFLTFS